MLQSGIATIFNKCVHFLFISTVKQDCKVTPWSEWGPCSPRCGVGVSQRTRSVLFLPLNGGKECPPLIENKGCFRHLCGGRELGKNDVQSFILYHVTLLRS